MADATLLTNQIFSKIKESADGLKFSGILKHFYLKRIVFRVVQKRMLVTVTQNRGAQFCQLNRFG